MTTVDPLAGTSARQPFRCSQCGRASWHPEDARNGYCGACHEYTGDLGDVDPIVPFLLARLDEEELPAKLAGNLLMYRDDRGNAYLEHPSGRRVDLTDLAQDSFEAAAWLEHAARHLPGRVLARVDGLRRIVLTEARARVMRDDVTGLEHRKFDELVTVVFGRGAHTERVTPDEYNARFTRPAPASDTLKAIAQAYGDHPDFRPEWTA